LQTAPGEGAHFDDTTKSNKIRINHTHTARNSAQNQTFVRKSETFHTQQQPHYGQGQNVLYLLYSDNPNTVRNRNLDFFCAVTGGFQAHAKRRHTIISGGASVALPYV